MLWQAIASATMWLWDENHMCAFELKRALTRRRVAAARRFASCRTGHVPRAFVRHKLLWLMRLLVAHTIQSVTDVMQ